MPPDNQAPGVYVEEIPSGVRSIHGVATSITAFLGRTLVGPTEAPSHIAGFSDFERIYGGLSLDSPLSYAVRHYFDNGGTHALIARIVHRDADGAEDATAPITDADISGAALEGRRYGLWLLDHADLVNVLCIPPLARGTDVAASTWDAAIRYATRRRAFVIVDPPAAWTTAAAALRGRVGLVDHDENAALYFPRITAADPLTGRPDEVFAPSGAIAGVFARTDATRGIWKAPAGATAHLVGVTGLSVDITDEHSGQLNPAAINTLREFPGQGAVVWGSRTLAGGDALASEWKYIPVRRLALFLEESLSRGTQWTVFQPNGDRLWAELRLNVGTFLHDLFRQGAFQGATPREAYFVKCDVETTTQADIDRGFVNILVGFAPLKPAEFVIVRIQQLTSHVDREEDNP